MVGLNPAPKRLVIDSLLRYFGGKRQAAHKPYRDFALDGIGVRTWDKLRQPIYLGAEGFVEIDTRDPLRLRLFIPVQSQ